MAADRRLLRIALAAVRQLLAFALAFLGWAYADAKDGSRFTFRQVLIAVLLGWPK